MTDNPETFQPLISAFVNEQVPEFVRQNHPKFVQFLEAFYQFLEQNHEAIGRMVDYTDIKDVDFTTDEFFYLFKSTFLSPMPEEFLADRALVLKKIKDLYAAKGTIPSIQLLFRILYGQEISVFLPKTKILRASDGKWQNRITLRVTQLAGEEHEFFRQSFIGETSGAIANVDFSETVQRGTLTVLEMTLVSYEGAFTVGEIIRDRVNGTATAQVLGIIDAVTVIDGGDDYQVGDIVPIIDPSGQDALVTVSQVAATYPIDAFIINDGGSNYRVGDPVDFSDNGGNGFGAVAQVSAINVQTSTFVLTSTIGEFQNTVLSTVASTAIEDFGASATIDQGEIAAIEVLDGGINYPSDPFVVEIGTQSPSFGLPAGSGADISATTKNTGEILEISVDNRGAGFTSGATADLTGIGDGTATAVVSVTGGPEVSGGFWKNTDGQLSSDMVLQDNVFYQNYSYEITSEVSINEWRDTVKNVTHPAGFALFGNLNITQLVQNPLRLNVENVEKTLVTVTTMPLGIDKHVFIDYEAFVPCQDYMVEPLVIGDYASEPISSYAEWTLQEFTECGYIEDYPEPIIQDYQNHLIETQANITIQEFIFGEGVCDPCYEQRSAVVDIVAPEFVGLAEGFRWSLGIPLVEDFENNDIEEFQNVQLFDFFNVGHPDVQLYEDSQIILLANQTLQAFYDDYELDDIYRQHRSVIETEIAP